MGELGQILKQKREELNKPLRSVAKETKIREPFLIMLEEGDYASLPSYIHAYGFVKQYAEYLGIPYDDIKPIFDAEYPKPRIENIPEQLTPMTIEDNKPRSKGFLIFVVILVLAIAGYYVVKSVIAKQSEPTPVTQVQPVVPAPVEIPEPAQPAPEPVADNKTINYVNLSEIASANNNGNGVPAEPIPDNATPPPPPVLPPVTQYVILSFTDTCWVSYTPDNGTMEEFTAVAGTTKRVPFINYFALNVGNAAALTIKHGTQTITDFGQQGAVLRNLRYELKDGVIARVRR